MMVFTQQIITCFMVVFLNYSSSKKLFQKGHLIETKKKKKGGPYPYKAR